MSAWLGVISAEHVSRAVELGIVQIGHGKRAGLARMSCGDDIVYYSAQHRLGDRRPLRQFTAIGSVADDTIWQADEGTFKPYRRRADYQRDAVPLPLQEVKTFLELTRSPNWGYQLRRGLIELSPHDFAILYQRMVGTDRPS